MHLPSKLCNRICKHTLRPSKNVVLTSTTRFICPLARRGVCVCACFGEKQENTMGYRAATVPLGELAHVEEIASTGVWVLLQVVPDL